jgi:O-antigen ligase
MHNLLSPSWMQDTTKLMYAWLVVIVGSIAGAVYFENALFALIPFIGAMAFYLVLDYRIIYYLFFAVVPFSIEYNFTPSLGTDLPSEPLMWIMFGISLLLFASKWQSKDNGRVFGHPITLVLMCHLAWILVTTILSQNTMLSTKIFVAKLWYIVPFYFLSIHILKSKKEYDTIFKLAAYMLSFSILIVMYKHYLDGFTFDKINHAVAPLFRNHVTYACIIVIMLPYVYTLFSFEEKASIKAIYICMILLYSAAIYLSYTRAAILCMVLMYPVYFIVKKRLMLHAILVSCIAAVVCIAALLYNNNYLRYAPEFEKTITHTEFDDLITATYNMEDISTMERVYRWVAGVEMVKAKPLFGFGPGTFYTYYSGYTVSSFQTYVSDNPEHSTVHNYYLLTFIEQGFVGFVIFISLCIVVLLYGEKVYHLQIDKASRSIVMAAIISFITILLLNTINDMIETDKVGPFFFLSMAIIVGAHRKLQIK